MQIWLDTIDCSLIEKARQMGILYGVTTNPSIAAKSDMHFEDLLEKILAAQSGPVAAQVTSNEASRMIAQGEALFKFSNRIIVKIPATEEGFKAIHALSPRIPTMATAVFDMNQVLLAAKSGAAYIAPYYSLICEADIDGIEAIRAMLALLQRYGFPSKLLAASLHSSEQVRELAEMGAHAVTLKEHVFQSFIGDNPRTLQSLDRFALDWAQAKRRRSLPL